MGVCASDNFVIAVAMRVCASDIFMIAVAMGVCASDNFIIAVAMGVCARSSPHFAGGRCILLGFQTMIPYRESTIDTRQMKVHRLRTHLGW